MKTLRVVLFLGILATLYVKVVDTFCNKDDRVKTVYDFFKTDKAFDVIAVGPSYLFCTVNPVILYEKTALKTYVIGTYSQTVEMTYRYFLEAINRFRPKLVILEASYFVRMAGKDTNSDEYIHVGTDQFPIGWNKIAMLRDCILQNGVETYLFPLMKYHSKWKCLTQKNFTSLADWPCPRNFNGFLISTRMYQKEGHWLDFSHAEKCDVFPGNLDILEKMKAVADAANCKVLMTISPRQCENEAMKGRYVTLCEFAKNHNIDILDLNLDPERMGLNMKTDMVDPRHLNVFGSEKATVRIAEFITRNYGIKPTPTEGCEQDWNSTVLRYYAQKEKLASKVLTTHKDR